jgi:hypothetical protein
MFIQTNSFIIFTCPNPVLASGKWVSMKTDLYKMVYIYVVELLNILGINLNMFLFLVAYLPKP